MPEIRVTTSAVLADFMPPGSHGKEATFMAPEGSSVQDIVKLLGLPEGVTYLIALNGEMLLTDAQCRAVVAKGDEIGIFPPLKGG